MNMGDFVFGLVSYLLFGMTFVIVFGMIGAPMRRPMEYCQAQMEQGGSFKGIACGMGFTVMAMIATIGSLLCTVYLFNTPTIQALRDAIMSLY